MQGNTTYSPSGTASWTQCRVDLGDSMVKVLTLPESHGRCTYVLSSAPRLVRSMGERPHVSFSLLLSRQPTPHENNVSPLIQSGVLTVDVQTGVAPEVMEVLATRREGPFKRLFAQLVDYTLLLGDGEEEPPRILAKAEGSGTEGRAGLSVHLDRSQALHVLGALEGASTPLRLSATVQYRVAAERRLVRLSGSWAAIHDFISSEQADNGHLTEAALHQLVPQMAAQHLLTATDEHGHPTDVPAEMLTRLFMRQAVVILRREPALNGQEQHYILRARPHESIRLAYTESYEREALQAFEVHASLEELLGSILDGQSWDDHVHLLAEDAEHPGHTAPVPRRVPARRVSRREAPGGGAGMKVAALGHSVTSLSLATSPSPTTSVRPHSAVLSRPSSTLSTIVLDDVRVELPSKDRPRSLPIIHDNDAPYWRDRLHRGTAWYAPAFEVVKPDPGASPETGPFLFSFERTGVTTSGQPALRGSVRFMLRQIMPDATAEAVKRDGLGHVRPVALDNLSVVLLIPFVDEADGRVKEHRFTATLDEEGDTLVATVTLLNDWVRLAYGALAVEGFQETPAQVQVVYAFTGYVPTREQDLQLAFGGKALHTPVVYSPAEAATLHGSTYFDAARLTYVQPRAELRYRRENEASSRDERRPSTSALTPVSLARPQLEVHKPQVTTTTVVRPELNVSTDISSLLKKVKYVTRTHVRQHTQAMLLPCSRFGRSYQEILGGAPSAIGCRDALTLGQTRYRLYEEVHELADASYRVYRSLQQPGHFLVAPTQFCISRRAAGEEDAYRPLVFLNALLDPAVAENNRVELRATLQPDLEPYQQRALAARLHAYDPDPVVQYLPDVAMEAVDFSWSLDPALHTASEADALDATGPFIGVYFRMDLASWQLMRSVLNSPGLSGSARFVLPDSSSIDAGLLLKLDRVRGPWTSGPLEVTVQDGQVRLINRVERSIEVSHLALYDASGEAQRVPVEVLLASGQLHTAASGDALDPVYHYPPSDPVALEEVRSFVEDIYSNLIFINLLNFANHNLIRLDIEARIEGIEGSYRAQLTEEVPVADIPIVLPLTSYLERRILEFRVAKLFSDRAAEMTDWMQWDLDTTVPVSLTAAVVGL